MTAFTPLYRIIPRRVIYEQLGRRHHVVFILYTSPHSLAALHLQRLKSHSTNIKAIKLAAFSFFNSLVVNHSVKRNGCMACTLLLICKTSIDHHYSSNLAYKEKQCQELLPQNCSTLNNDFSMPEVLI